MPLHKHPANISNIIGMPLIMAAHYLATNKQTWLFILK